jgi:hypothetical protein
VPEFERIYGEVAERETRISPRALLVQGIEECLAAGFK